MVAPSVNSQSQRSPTVASLATHSVLVSAAMAAHRPRWPNVNSGHPSVSGGPSGQPWWPNANHDGQTSTLMVKSQPWWPKVNPGGQMSSVETKHQPQQPRVNRGHPKSTSVSKTQPRHPNAPPRHGLDPAAGRPPLVESAAAALGAAQAGDLGVLDRELVVVGDLLVDADRLLRVDDDLLLRLDGDDLGVAVGLGGGTRGQRDSPVSPPPPGFGDRPGSPCSSG